MVAKKDPMDKKYYIFNMIFYIVLAAIAGGNAINIYRNGSLWFIFWIVMFVCAIVYSARFYYMLATINSKERDEEKDE